MADFHDLARLLSENPQWRAELRRLVLIKELLELPALVRAWPQKGFFRWVSPNSSG